MRLNQRYGNVNIWSHFFSNRKGGFGLSFLRFYPLRLQNFRTIFNTHQSATVGSGGEGDHSLLAYLISVFIGRENKHFRTFCIPIGWTFPPISVERSHSSRSVSGLRILNPN